MILITILASSTHNGVLAVTIDSDTQFIVGNETYAVDGTMDFSRRTIDSKNYELIILSEPYDIIWWIPQRCEA